MRREKSEQQPNSIHAGGPGKRASRSRNKDPRRLPSPQPECSVSPAERKSQPRSESARHAERDSRKEEASRAKRKRCRRFVFRERRRAAKAAAAKRTHSRTPFPLRREDQPILPPPLFAQPANQRACPPPLGPKPERSISRVLANDVEKAPPFGRGKPRLTDCREWTLIFHCLAARSSGMRRYVAADHHPLSLPRPPLS